METIQTTRVIYTAKTHTTGGRDGISKSSDGHLDIKLSTPGTNGAGTNPEQLFAAGWSACFEGAMAIIAGKKHITLPENTAVDAEVDLCLADGGYYLQARLNILIPGLGREEAHQIIDASRRACPYSKAMEGNVNVSFNLV